MVFFYRKVELETGNFRGNESTRIEISHPLVHSPYGYNGIPKPHCTCAGVQDFGPFLLLSWLHQQRAGEEVDLLRLVLM